MGVLAIIGVIAIVVGVIGLLAVIPLGLPLSIVVILLGVVLIAVDRRGSLRL